MSARAPAGVKSGLESYTKLPFEKVSADVTVWTPPTRCHVTVSPAVIRIVPGEKPLNHTTPPGASGAPAVTPPIYTSCVVAAKLRETEKRNVMKRATDRIASTLGQREADRFTFSTCCGESRLLVFNARQKSEWQKSERSLADGGSHEWVRPDLNR